MRRPRTLALVIGALALAVAGCGSSNSSPTAKTPEVSPAGDVPDTQAFVGFTSPSGAYTIQVPEGWARSTDGTEATFADHFNTVTIDATTNASAPSPARVRTVDVPSLQRAGSGFRLGSIATASRTAGPATIVTYRVKSAPDSVTGKRIALDAQRFQFWHNGELVTITVSAPQGSDNVDAWKTITNSFAWSR